VPSRRDASGVPAECQLSDYAGAKTRQIIRDEKSAATPDDEASSRSAAVPQTLSSKFRSLAELQPETAMRFVRINAPALAREEFLLLTA
jgi:hypothetical protein